MQRDRYGALNDFSILALLILLSGVLYFGSIKSVVVVLVGIFVVDYSVIRKAYVFLIGVWFFFVLIFTHIFILQFFNRIVIESSHGRLPEDKTDALYHFVVGMPRL